MTDTGRILEWIKYGAYGVPRRIPASDFNRDDFVDFFDNDDFAAAMSAGADSADANYSDADTIRRYQVCS